MKLKLSNSRKPAAKHPKLFALLAGLLVLPIIAEAGPGSPVKQTGKRPNIVVIVADDLGYADIGVQGGKDIPTPNVDALARSGIRFTSGYVSGPYCSPTRAGFLTGRYQQRFGHEFNPGRTGENGESIGLSLKEKTIADRLKSAGYTTGLVGKWHQGFSDEYNPVNRGFDEHFGFLGAARTYTNRVDINDPIRRGLQVVGETNYLTDAFTREAVAFIERHKKDEKPFFLYLAYNAVHSPLDVHPRFWDRFAHIEDPKRRRFATMLAALDEGVGAVTEKLRAASLEEDTLLVFFSDNGGPTRDNTSRNDPLRGFKATTWEGGVRVPFLISWKGRLPAGTVDDRPIIQLDILPTALAAAGATINPEWKLDGVNLLPYLTGERSGRPHDALFWRFGQQIAIRKGDWKLVKALSPDQPRLAYVPGAKASADGAELYNLANDIAETNNLAGEHPGVVKELTAAWNAWNAELVDPSWGPGNRQRRRDGNPTSNASTNGPWKSGDVLESADAPNPAQVPFAIAVEVEQTATNGVIVAQGASRNGYAVYVENGRPVFAVRTDGTLTVARAAEPLTRASHRIEARLEENGTLVLQVDGKEAAKAKGPGLIPAQPADAFSVGQDVSSPVAEYESPNPFSGKVKSVRFTRL